SQEWLLIILASAGLLVIYVLNTGLMAVVTYWGHMLGINIETDMRRAAFNHLQKLSFGYFDNQKTGHIVGRLTKDLEEIGEVAHHGPEDLFIALMTFIGALLLMFSVNWQMAVITATIVPVTAWATSHFGGRMTENFHRLFSRIGEFNARIEENVGGMRVVQAFANEGHERALFEKDNQSYRRVKLEAYKLMAATSSMSYLSMRLTQMVVMVTGAYFVLAGELTAGGFIGFLLLVGIFFRPVEKINSVIETYPKGIAGFRRFTELIDTEPDIADAPDAVAVDHLKGEIAYRSVTFGYTAAKTVFEEINLDIRAGETIAFVGPSGAGKTTICSLLPRFYEVVSG
ncbi:MAG: ABC transporter ATP-binding protein, partial [Rhizobiaceae bacterium]